MQNQSFNVSSSKKREAERKIAVFKRNTAELPNRPGYDKWAKLFAFEKDDSSRYQIAECNDWFGWQMPNN